MDLKHPHVDAQTTCACGHVHLNVSGQPVTMLLCTCQDCQKASGSGHAALALFETEAVEVAGIVSGYSVTAASGSVATRFFCPNCGTPVYGETERMPHLRLLPVGLFDDQSWFAPRTIIFERSHQHWDSLPEHVPAYSTYKHT